MLLTNIIEKVLPDLGLAYVVYIPLLFFKSDLSRYCFVQSDLSRYCFVFLVVGKCTMRR